VSLFLCLGFLEYSCLGVLYVSSSLSESDAGNVKSYGSISSVILRLALFWTVGCGEAVGGEGGRLSDVSCGCGEAEGGEGSVLW
jgi:hypothetical protein